MQTALHILSLVNELQSEAVGGKVIGTEFYRKDRAFYLFIKKKQRLALGFVYHPVRWGTYLVAASKVKIETREKPRPIFDISDATITGLEQLGLDRIFTVTLQHGKKISKLVVEAIGPNGNIWLLDEHDGKLATLRRKDFKPGHRYAIQPIKEQLNPISLTESDLADGFKQHPDLPVALFVERHVRGFNTTLAREVVHRADQVDVKAGEINDASLKSLSKAIRQICNSFESSSAGYVYSIRGRFEAYPLKLSSCQDQPQRFKTLSLAVLASAESRDSAAEQEDEVKTVTDAVKKAVRRMERRIKKIEQDVNEAADYEKYRRLGELLQINFKAIKKGMSSIEVEDVYSESHGEVQIKLDPALTPNENAEAYFKRYRKGREGLNLLRRRLEISKDELKELTVIQSELEHDFETARRKYEPEILSLLPGEKVEREVAPRLPYRPHVLSSGLTIFVGRDGADNDRTTFEFARPYELWFHTQQCAGSHVVMKFPNKSFEPSRREIEETAAIAAYFSKARKDSLVPVIYTQRKYVRKPRKAKPGLVLVEREKSVMVEPAKPPASA
ncbi:MAG: NFACT family protein [Candidatus Zixiibacteriota bacterium]|nr:MAG: NFACT family protein [candidate division Zixibacteria bacterium]